jgi:hypothetical protein
MKVFRQLKREMDTDGLLKECVCQCRDKTPAILPVLPMRAAVNLGGDAVGTLQ